MNPTTNGALWALGRGTGIVALVLFTLSICLGIWTRSGRALPGLGRIGTSAVHQTAALTGTALIVVHVASLYFDPYAQLRLVDVVIPFLGNYRPLWQGLGTLAVDLLVLITTTSLLRVRIGPRAFKAVHWLTYALWPVALLHGLGNGTDGTTWWFRGIAVLCGLVVLGSVAWRLASGFEGRGYGHVRNPRRIAS